EVRSIGDNAEYPPLIAVPDQQSDEVACRRVRPVHILNTQQERSPDSTGAHVVSQCMNEQVSLLLRRMVVASALARADQVQDQSPARRVEQRQLVEPLRLIRPMVH